MLTSVWRTMEGVLRSVSIFLEATPVLGEVVQLWTSASLRMEDVNTCVRKVESVPV
jgi:hypothetical protein